jgi:two-component system, NtrC family, response regulator GlrR
MTKLLLIEDGEALLGETFASPPLADAGWRCDRAIWNSFAFESLGRIGADMIVASGVLAQSRLLAFSHWLRVHPIRIPTIAVLPEDSEDELLRTCFETADDCVLCPFRPDELRQRITRILGSDNRGAAAVGDRLNCEFGLARLVGTDKSFLHEIAKIPLAARSDGEVLITGETGTGKELCARAIHELSRRRSRPFVCVDCAALPDQLFENEMFGHERGAFTDAYRAQKGLVAIAEGGTLFFDEIDSLSLWGQAKLLRILQDRTYRPLGAEKFARANVRIVAASNRDLSRAIENMAFRRDLFFRINVLRLHMIPLRERPGDIAPLAQHFLSLSCAEMRSARKVMAPSTLRLLESLDWPGNVRELCNVVRRAVVFSKGLQILPAHIATTEEAAASSDLSPTLSFSKARAEALNAFERRYTKAMLRKHNGNITRAAREAGKDRRAFGRLVKRHNIDPRCDFE